MTHIKNNYSFYIYYILLLAIFLSWNNFSTVPGPIVRIVYWGAVIVPVIVWKKSWLVPVVLLFYSLAKCSYTSSFLPAENYTYIVSVLLVSIFVHARNRLKTPLCLYLMLIVPFIINTAANTTEQISFASFMIILFLLIIDGNDDKQLDMMSLSFIVLSLVLSISYYLYGSNFASVLNEYENERIGFADINYVGCIMGFGVIMALVSLIYDSKVPILKKAFYIFVIVISIISMLSNASRGSILALGVGVIVIILFSHISIRLKIVISLFIVGLLVVLYNNHYLDLLLFRIENDEIGGGTGRVDIWRDKWAAFSSSSSMLNIILGYGYEGGRRLGGGYAFHNDFLAFLVEYGIVGLIVLLSFLSTPLIRSNKENRPIVLASLAYLITVGLTLEPLAAGRLPFYAIWLYAYLAANYDFQRIDKKET